LLRVILSGTLTLAGVSKVLDIPPTKETLRAFGVPGNIVGLGAWLLIGVEMVLGVLLLMPPTAWWATACACLTLCVFFRRNGELGNRSAPFM
jgi:uncharacterized membrane protein YphA (DoxX/SURF4 family)